VRFTAKDTRRQGGKEAGRGGKEAGREGGREGAREGGKDSKGRRLVCTLQFVQFISISRRFPASYTSK